MTRSQSTPNGRILNHFKNPALQQPLSFRFLQHDLSGTSAEYAELLFELETAINQNACIKLPQDRDTVAKQGEGRARKTAQTPEHKYNRQSHSLTVLPLSPLASSKQFL